jgi:hypothetical protein
MTTSQHQASPARAINHEASFHKTPELIPAIIGSLTGAALRYDAWPSLNGEVSFGFNWDLIHADSHVYISTSEVDNAGNRFNGSAVFTVQNIIPKEGRVEFRVFIGWDSPIRISTDILVINP